MTRLVRVELRRLFARRLVRFAMLGVLVVSALLLVAVWNSSQPMSPQELAQAEQYYEQEMEAWAEYGEEQVAQCLADQEAESERLGEPVDYACEEMEPQRDWYIWTAPPLEESLPNFLHPHATLLIFAALLIGATFTAAEMSTGSISTWLSFEPRRLRVFASKLVAAAVGVVPVSVLAVAVVVAGAVAISGHFDLLDGWDAAAWADTGQMAVRVVSLVVLAALVGAALGFLLRHTAAVLGVAVVCLIGETMFAALVPRLQPWLLSTNLNGWILDGTMYFIEDCTTDATGTFCDYTERSLSFGHSAAYLLVLGAVLVAVSALVFRRRDAA